MAIALENEVNGVDEGTVEIEQERGESNFA
jgi:hypothetical protein